MKRLLSFVVVAFVALLCADRTSAQINCGVIGGATFSTTNIKEFGNGTMTQYHAGFTMRVKLPVGFSIQPSLIYQVKGANTAVDGVASSTKVGYLELPVSLQWNMVSELVWALISGSFRLLPAITGIWAHFQMA